MYSASFCTCRTGCVGAGPGRGAYISLEQGCILSEARWSTELGLSQGLMGS